MSPAAPPLKLSPADWACALRLLDEALDAPPADTERWLDGMPADLQHLRPALRRLLAERGAIESQEFLCTLPPMPAPSRSALGDFAPGHPVGPYVLLRELGAGGMASVWLAARSDGAHGREVALKLPWLGARAAVIGERFARERSILSGLSHPHIASVLDAGTHGRQPWLAMEYIEGLPITDWAARQALDVPARLALMLQVLQAVQHAHAQLVIHRDIKPANVLVDAHGQVKLLDFGVAKLMDDTGSSPETELTRVGGRALTPQYASPEQIAGAPLGTATDVYSLGVLMHELLTGRLPYALKRATPAAMEEAILTAATRLPSTAAGEAGDTRAQRALRGDVDTIVAKAMAVRPADRYASAEALAQDIQRHLAALPILARPASWTYRAGRLFKRHGLAVAAGSAMALALLVGAGLALWQADRASGEARRAEAVKTFLTDTLSHNDPDQARGRALSGRELLDLSASQIDTRFAADPATRADLHHTVGGIYVALGSMPLALPHLDAAIAGFEADGRRGSTRHLEALMSRAEVFDELADYDAARRATQTAQREAERALGAGHPWAARLLANLAWFDQHQGRVAEARALAEEALQMQQRLGGETSRHFSHVATVLAHLYIDIGEPLRARALLQRLQRLGDADPTYPAGDRLMDRYNLARVQYIVGDFAALEAPLRALVPQMDRHFGAAHDRTIIARSLLAQTLAQRGFFDEALAWQRDTLARVAARRIDGDEAAAQQTLVLALLLNIAGRPDEALAPAREGQAYFQAKYPQPTAYRERGRWILGEVMLGVGDRAGGEAALHEVQRQLDVLSAQGGHIAKAPNLLSLAVLQRLPGDVPAVCEEYGQRVGAEAQTSLRCHALRTWLQALPLEGDARSAAMDRFRAARDRLLAVLPDRHGLRAELLAAEAEIQAPLDAVAAAVLRQRADAEHRRIFGRALPEPLLVVH